LWLVPFITGTRFSPSAQVLHVICFVLTLQASVWVSYGITLALGDVLGQNRGLFGLTAQEEMTVLAATIAWVIALYLFAKKCQKWMRREEASSPAELVPLAADPARADYGSADDNNDDNNHGDDKEEESEQGTIRELFTKPALHDPMPGTVVSLTALGALDEVPFPPSLNPDPSPHPAGVIFPEPAHEPHLQCVGAIHRRRLRMPSTRRHHSGGATDVRARVRVPRQRAPLCGGLHLRDCDDRGGLVADQH
jgi:hypothetical protein